MQRFKGLNAAMVELIEEFGMVSFQTLAVEVRTLLVFAVHLAELAG
jgi:hypothetical protein